MKKKYSILVTGACAVSARSVVRSLKMSEIFGDAIFIGTDFCENLYPIYEGLYNKIYWLPLSNDPTYRPMVDKIIKKEKIDVAIILPEREVLYWSENPFDIPCLLPPPKFSRLVISKRRLYESLEGSGLIPDYQIIDREAGLSHQFTPKLNYPLWIRDYSDATASGKGSYLAHNISEIQAWIIINSGINNFMLAEYLPGLNYGCFCLFNNGELKKICIAERIIYFMSKVAISGITGNTSKGKLLNNEKIKENTLKAIEILCNQTGEPMNGLVVTDLKCDKDGFPFITEINIRHVAFSSSFANAGFNISEYHLLCALGKFHDLGNEIEKIFPPNNLILRDIDGLPIYVEDYKPMEFITEI